MSDDIDVTLNTQQIIALRETFDTRWREAFARMWATGEHCARFMRHSDWCPAMSGHHNCSCGLEKVRAEWEALKP